MEYKLRHYQKEAVTKAVEFFLAERSKTRPILVMPTGSGKSLVIADITRQLQDEVLILQPSLELLEQNYKKYQAVCEEYPELVKASIYSASVGIKEKGQLTFATIGSIYKNPELFASTQYVIVDECQNVPPKDDSMYVEFLSRLTAKVLGLTATPIRLKTYNDPFTYKKFSKVNLLIRERPQFFNKFAHVTQVSQMYEEGFLAPINYVEMQFDGSFLKVNSTGAEYSDSSLKEAIERNEIIKKIPLILKQAYEKGQRSCLVFVRSVEEARELAETTPFSAYIHAMTPKPERANIIKGFKSGSIKTLFNVAVLTTGFDYPALDTIILARPTMSLTLYTQIVGRGMRIAPGKTKCTFIDMCDNIKRFGKVEEQRYEEDPKLGWVLRNNEKVLSGRRLDELI